MHWPVGGRDVSTCNAAADERVGVCSGYENRTEEDDEDEDEEKEEQRDALDSGNNGRRFARQEPEVQVVCAVLL